MPTSQLSVQVLAPTPLWSVQRQWKRLRHKYSACQIVWALASACPETAPFLLFCQSGKREGGRLDKDPAARMTNMWDLKGFIGLFSRNTGLTESIRALLVGMSDYALSAQLVWGSHTVESDPFWFTEIDGV